MEGELHLERLLFKVPQETAFEVYTGVHWWPSRLQDVVVSHQIIYPEQCFCIPDKGTWAPEPVLQGPVYAHAHSPIEVERLFTS